MRPAPRKDVCLIELKNTSTSGFYVGFLLTAPEKALE